MNSVPIHLQRWNGSMRITPNQIANAQCKCNQCALNSVLVSSVKRPLGVAPRLKFLIILIHDIA